MSCSLSPFSPFEQYIPRIRRTRSILNLSLEFEPTSVVRSTGQLEWPNQQPHPRRPLLLHPLYSTPQRYWHLANGNQRIVNTSGAFVPPNRRKDPHLPEFTLRHYSTQPLVCARPSTINRYFHLTPNRQWEDRINYLIGDLGRISRTMNRWNSIKPEQRYMLRPLVPHNLCRSVSTTDIPYR